MRNITGTSALMLFAGAFCSAQAPEFKVVSVKPAGTRRDRTIVHTKPAKELHHLQRNR